MDTSTLPSVLAISAVSLAELSAGVHAVQGSGRAASVERARRTQILQLVEDQFTAIPFGEDAARAYGTLAASVIARGRQPRGRIADLMIATKAIAEGIALFTTNPRDFAGAEGLLDVVEVVVS